MQLVTWNDYGEGTIIEPTEETGYQYLEIVQETRQTIDSGFEADSEALRLPLELFNLRRTHQDDAELDRVFEALIAGEIATARTILDTLQTPES